MNATEITEDRISIIIPLYNDFQWWSSVYWPQWKTGIRQWCFQLVTTVCRTLLLLSWLNCVWHLVSLKAGFRPTCALGRTQHTACKTQELWSVGFELLHVSDVRRRKATITQLWFGNVLFFRTQDTYAKIQNYKMQRRKNNLLYSTTSTEHLTKKMPQ